MRKKGLSLLLCIITLAACVPPHIIEDIQMVEVIGYDYVNPHIVQVTASASTYQGSEAGTTVHNETLTTQAHTSKDNRRAMQGLSPKPIQSGKIKTVLYEDKLAKRGIFSYMDSLNRDATVGKLLYLAVTDGKTQNLLAGNYPISTSVSKYLSDLFEQNMKGNFPEVNLHSFLYAYHAKGMDPFLPFIEQKGDKIQIKGLALFKNDHYVDSLSFKDCFIFKILNEKVKLGLYELRVKPNQFLDIEAIGSKVAYHITGGSTHPTIRIRIKLQGMVNEAPKFNLQSEDSYKRIEKKLTQDLEKKTQQMIKRFQREGIDPLGLGDQAKSQNRHWNEQQWKDNYPHAEVHVNIDTQIKETGIKE